MAVAGDAVGFEAAVDEAVEAFVRVGEEGAAGDDEDPVGVPDAAADEAGVGAEFGFGVYTTMGLKNCGETVFIGDDKNYE